ncbi:hypothetical protein [Lacticaseibacillus absianus]|uniref:hypothetical protein n=1 Tax=Lacticaseibacillus absianus TaxID=2729623 RepID=UPI0015C7C41A|nr:hypothetical protein [Lacticaseibacillus absianus]
MKLDVAQSIANLKWTVDHHFLHIRDHSPFARAIAVQFELAYTDFRVIEMSLQLRGPETHAVLVDFAQTYTAVQRYEWPFIAGGPEEYYAQHGADFSDYQQQVTHLDDLLDTIAALD